MIGSPDLPVVAILSRVPLGCGLPFPTSVEIDRTHACDPVDVLDHVAISHSDRELDGPPRAAAIWPL